MIKFILLLLILAVTACSAPSPRPVLLEPVSAQLGNVRVSRGNVQVKEIHRGVVKAHSEAVRVQTGSGILGTIYAWPGDEVTTGQLLARMDTENILERYEAQTLRISNMRRQHDFVNEENALEIAALELSYASTVWAAAEEFDTAAMERAEQIRESIEWANLTKQQTIAIQNANMARELQRLTDLSDALADANIYAPFDGVISYMAVNKGAWVNNFDPVMYIICHNADVFVEYVGQSLTLNQARFPIRKQGHVGTAVFDLTLIPPTAEQQEYYIRRNLPPPIRYRVSDGVQLPPVGTSVSLNFYSRFYEDVLRVPRNALFTHATYGSFVYRIEDGQMVQTFVTIGTITETYAPVFGGLQEGDEIFVRS